MKLIHFCLLRRPSYLSNNMPLAKLQKVVMAIKMRKRQSHQP